MRDLALVCVDQKSVNRMPPHTNNTRKQHTQQGTTPPQPGRRSKEAATTCAVIINVVPRPKPQPAASSSGHLNSSSMSYHHQAAHTVVDPSALTLLRRNTPVAAPMKPPILATLCGAPASSTASLLFQELGYLRLLRKGHLYSVITEITTAPSVPT
jgi:hypothetical protein